jgi:hypothetical protein
VPGLIAVARSSAGSVANAQMLAAGEVESALVQSDVAYAAHEGAGPFVGRPELARLRAIAHLYPEAVHLVVRPDPRIDAPGSGTAGIARLVLEAYGLVEAELSILPLSAAQAVEAMARGEVDAFFMVGGWPLQPVAEAVRRTGARLLPLAGPEAAGLVRRYPFFTFDLVPFAAYGALPAVETISVGALWVVEAAIDEGLVHDLTRALWHPRSLEHLRRGHPRGADIDLDAALQGISVPLHPGAERWYREQGRLRGR